MTKKQFILQLKTHPFLNPSILSPKACPLARSIVCSGQANLELANAVADAMSMHLLSHTKLSTMQTQTNSARKTNVQLDKCTEDEKTLPREI